MSRQSSQTATLDQTLGGKASNRAYNASGGPSLQMDKPLTPPPQPPTNDVIAIGNTVKIFNKDYLDEINVLGSQPLPHHKDLVRMVSFSKNRTWLASASYDQTVAIWVVAQRKVVTVLNDHHAAVRSVRFSHDDQLLASGGEDNNVIVYKTADWSKLIDLKGHTKMVVSLSWAPDSKHLCSGSTDNYALVWDTSSGQQKGKLQHPNFVKSVSWSPDGRVIATGGNDYKLVLWNAVSFQPWLILEGHQSYILCVEYSHDGKTIASASWDHSLRLWDGRTGQCKAVLQGHAGAVLGCSFSPGSRILASCSDDGSVRIWNCTTFQAIGSPMGGHTDQVMDVKIATDGKTIATASKDKTVRMWDLARGRCVGEVAFDSPVVQLNFVPNGQLVKAADQRGNHKTITVGDLSMLVVPPAACGPCMKCGRKYQNAPKDWKCICDGTTELYPHDTETCRQCNKEFGVFLWRNHCRGCGLSFCSDDCNNNAYVWDRPPQGFKLAPGQTDERQVKVCFECLCRAYTLDSLYHFEKKQAEQRAREEAERQERAAAAAEVRRKQDELHSFQSQWKQAAGVKHAGYAIAPDPAGRAALADLLQSASGTAQTVEDIGLLDDTHEQLRDYEGGLVQATASAEKKVSSAETTLHEAVAKVKDDKENKELRKARDEAAAIFLANHKEFDKAVAELVKSKQIMGKNLESTGSTIIGSLSTRKAAVLNDDQVQQNTPSDLFIAIKAASDALARAQHVALSADKAIRQQLASSGISFRQANVNSSKISDLQKEISGMLLEHHSSQDQKQRCKQANQYIESEHQKALATSTPLVETALYYTQVACFLMTDRVNGICASASRLAPLRDGVELALTSFDKFNQDYNDTCDAIDDAEVHLIRLRRKHELSKEQKEEKQREILAGVAAARRKQGLMIPTLVRMVTLMYPEHRGKIQSATEQYMESDGVISGTTSLSMFEIDFEHPLSRAGETARHTVYKGVMEGKKYALKQYRLDDKFYKEVRTLSRMAHPYVIPITSAFVETNSVGESYGYIQMPFQDGGEFADWIKKYGGKEHHQQVLRIVHQVLQALQHLHNHSCIHSDIKPGNVLMADKSADAKPVLTDFDTARTQAQLGQHFVSTAATTRVSGTFKYMSPEVSEVMSSGSAEEGARKLTTALDIYSLGILFLETRCPNLDIQPGTGKPKIPSGVFGTDEEDLLNHMLEQDFKKRFTAEQCLHHRALDLAAKAVEREQELLAEKAEHSEQMKKEQERLKQEFDKMQSKQGNIQAELARMQAHEAELERKRKEFQSKTSQADSRIAAEEARVKKEQEEMKRRQQQLQNELSGLKGQQAMMDAEKQALEQKRAQVANVVSNAATSVAPMHWTIGLDHPTPMRVAIPRSDPRWQKIQDTLERTKKQKYIGQGRDNYGLTHRGYQLTGAWQLMNPTLWKKYVVEREAIARKKRHQPCPVPAQGWGWLAQDIQCRSDVNETVLFHGTKPQIVDILCRDGFDPRVCSDKGLFGAGIYAAANSSKSDEYCVPDSNKDCWMFIARVVLGTPHIAMKAYQNIRRPCCVQGHNLALGEVCSHELADSEVGPCVEDGPQFHNAYLKKYPEYVVYDANQLYAELLISYKRV